MSEIPRHFERLTPMDEVWRAASAGMRLDGVRRQAPRLREAIGASGVAEGVRTFDLITFPYPARFGLGGAAILPSPYVMMRNRVQIVQYATKDGRLETLLVNPSDYERGQAAPFFAKQVERMGEFLSRRVFSQRHGTVAGALEAAGLRPEDVDYVTFDHLHVQDLRGLLGTEDGAIPALLPRAKLLAQAAELAILERLHPTQRPWYVADGLRGVPRDRIVALDGDYLLGAGVAIVRTPGHTAGNHTIVLATDTGLWTISENGVAVDSYAPYASEIPGLRRYAAEYEVEVILNANTREMTCDQYSSMVLERTLADASAVRPEFPQHFPSSEMVAHPIAMGLKPTFTHGAITHGRIVRPERAAAA